MTKSIRRVPAQLEWLEGALPGRIQLHISGSRSALIENFYCVQEFLPERIRISGAGGLLTVNGCGLTLSEVRPGSLIIRGEIHEILLPQGCGEA